MSAPIIKWTLADSALEEMPPLRRATEGSAGFDLIAVDRHILEGPAVHKIQTGIKVEIPVGYVGVVLPRSSLGKKGFILANTAGVIDSDYRGEIILLGKMRGKGILHIDEGERIAQLLVIPALHAEAQFVQELSDTKRGSGGFGSTGK